MGSFMTMPVETCITQFDLNAFVETGTYLGAGVACARGFRRLTEIHSVEMKREFYLGAKYMFTGDDRVKIWCGDSQEKLPDILSLPSLEDKRILFWLDAHHPKFYGYDEGTKLPLEAELTIIAETRPRNNDVIIIDDLRMYIEDDYEYGNDKCADNCDFVEKIMGERYDIIKSLQHHGYLILLPK